MDIILHLGAHRTASTSFQRYMRSVSDALAAGGTGFWGPGRTRKGLFHRVGTREARIATGAACNWPSMARRGTVSRDW